MSNALVNVTVPAHILARQQARQELVNVDAMSGMTVPQPPSIKLNGKQFVFDADGVQKPHDQLAIAAVILRAKKTLDKTWYATAYTPGQDVQSPDCFSTNGVMPEPGGQFEGPCATCPMNQFGSGKDQAGNAMKGKACADYKSLAVFAKGGVWKLRLPPKSFKNFGAYVSSLTARNIDLTDVVTKIGFDFTESSPVLTFDMHSFITEAAAPTIDAAKESYECLQIAQVVVPPTPVAQLPAPKPVAPPAPPVVEAEEVELDLGLGATPAAAVAPAKPKAPAKAKPVAPPVVVASDEPSIEDLAASLGI